MSGGEKKQIAPSKQGTFYKTFLICSLITVAPFAPKGGGGVDVPGQSFSKYR